VVAKLRRFVETGGEEGFPGSGCWAEVKSDYARVRLPRDGTEKASRLPGRGKRSNPNYVSSTAYIPVALLEAVKAELKARAAGKLGGPKDFSSLLDALLSMWLDERNPDLTS
jgi:hypothetical protein